MRKGSVLISLGLALILGAAALTAWNLLEAGRAQKHSTEAVTTLRGDLAKEAYAKQETTEVTPEEGTFPMLVPGDVPDYIRYPDMEMPVEEFQGYYYVGILEIPALELQLPVIDQWSYPGLKIAPCRYQGSAYTGDLILMAHNYESHFGRLKELRPGDRVAFTDMDGNLFVYEVVEFEELPGNAVEEMEAGEWDMTLFTCTYGGRSRVVIRCEEVRKV